MELIDYKEANVKVSLFFYDPVDQAVCLFDGADGNVDPWAPYVLTYQFNEDSVLLYECRAMILRLMFSQILERYCCFSVTMLTNGSTYIALRL